MAGQAVGIVDFIYFTFLILAILILVVSAATHSAASKSHKELQKINAKLLTMIKNQAIASEEAQPPDPPLEQEPSASSKERAPVTQASFFVPQEKGEETSSDIKEGPVKPPTWMDKKRIT